MVDLPPGFNPLESIWLLKRKLKTDGSVDKHNSRLVVQGHRQKKCVDLFDIYSPVTRKNSTRLLIAIA